ncbi:MAG: hypothetical protein ACFB51_06995, partial [Anaerolineae bacterium]
LLTILTALVVISVTGSRETRTRFEATATQAEVLLSGTDAWLTRRAIVRASYTPIPALQTVTPFGTPAPTLSEPERTATADIQLRAADLAAGLSADSLPLAWPVPPFSTGQIAQARACTIVESRLWGQMFLLEAPDILIQGYPATDCDWARLAVVYTRRVLADSGTLDPTALGIIAETMHRNPAFALARGTQSNLGEALLVAPPTGVPVARVEMAYSLTTDAPQPYTESFGAVLHAGEVPLEAVGAALGNFVPVDRITRVPGCVDELPSWALDVAFADGSTLALTNAGSNLSYRIGGPWFFVKEGQAYMQIGPHLTEALIAVLAEAGLSPQLPAFSRGACPTGGPDLFNLLFEE